MKATLRGALILLPVGICLFAMSAVAGIDLQPSFRWWQAPATTTEPHFDYLGMTPPGMEPARFAPGILPPRGTVMHSAPVFSPDGSMVVFSVQEPPDYDRPIIMIMVRTGMGVWTPPQTAPFASEYGDDGPFFSPDGQRLYLTSWRPLSPGAAPPDTPTWWIVPRNGAGWGTPRPVQSPADLPHDDGILYAALALEAGYGDLDLYRLTFTGEAYSPPQNLGPVINTAAAEYAPCAFPAYDALIFNRFDPRTRELGLYASFRAADGGWQEPVNMAEHIPAMVDARFAALSPDGRVLFFTGKSGDDSVVYWVDAAILARMSPDNAARNLTDS